MACSFLDKLTRRIKDYGTILCVGVDPNIPCRSVADLSPTELQQVLEALHKKCTHLIQRTSDFVCCFKLNVAFFEQYGPGGMEVLKQVCTEIPEDIPVIIDAKRSATGEAAEAYAHAFFSIYGADCITLDPYLGENALVPFLKKKGKGIFVVCRSSNPRSSDLQGLVVSESSGEAVGQQTSMELFMRVAHMCDSVKKQNEPALTENGGVVGLVVGSTYPDDMRRIRSVFPDLWFLSPGIGAQGGDLEATIDAGLRRDGLGLIVNVGRAISEAEDPGRAAEAYRKEMNDLIAKLRASA
ncbi:orotidine-monophosphate-decarboxylase, putative [Eimeria praecox]|uniref:Orotidine 5'-phosphate decarboxylase n=1 Tax=Eimeria praecox TaxID=51316 RepID=U6GJU0_9EIME|nr:orotidine-monophosphate-decarboxylase, putative [Eimeria praecox]